jgi:hypothetical protein
MNRTDSTESGAALTELIAEYQATQVLKIGRVNALGGSFRLWEKGILKSPD